jgi:hypothetical protein
MSHPTHQRQTISLLMMESTSSGGDTIQSTTQPPKQNNEEGDVHDDQQQQLLPQRKRKREQPSASSSSESLSSPLSVTSSTATKTASMSSIDTWNNIHDDMVLGEFADALKYSPPTLLLLSSKSSMMAVTSTATATTTVAAASTAAAAAAATDTSSTSQEQEIERLPWLLRLLSLAQSQASIPRSSLSRKDNNNKDNYDEQMNDSNNNNTCPADSYIDDAVSRLEDRAAWYPSSESIYVMACHLAPVVTQPFSYIHPPFKKRFFAHYHRRDNDNNASNDHNNDDYDNIMSNIMRQDDDHVSTSSSDLFQQQQHDDNDDDDRITPLRYRSSIPYQDCWSIDHPTLNTTNTVDDLYWDDTDFAPWRLGGHRRRFRRHGHQQHYHRDEDDNDNDNDDGAKTVVFDVTGLQAVIETSYHDPSSTMIAAAFSHEPKKPLLDSQSKRWKMNMKNQHWHHPDGAAHAIDELESTIRGSDDEMEDMVDDDDYDDDDNDAADSATAGAAASSRDIRNLDQSYTKKRRKATSTIRIGRRLHRILPGRSDQKGIVSSATSSTMDSLEKNFESNTTDVIAAEAAAATASTAAVSDSLEIRVRRIIAELVHVVIYSLQHPKPKTMGNHMNIDADDDDDEPNADNTVMPQSSMNSSNYRINDDEKHPGGSLDFKTPSDVDSSYHIPTTEDSLLAEPRLAVSSSKLIPQKPSDSPATLANIDGVTSNGGSDLSATIVSLLYYIPVIRHRHVSVRTFCFPLFF